MHENVPVRFGRGRLDSLVTKGLAAYLIARSTRVLPPAPGRISRRDPLRTGNENRPLPWATGLMEERSAYS